VSTLQAHTSPQPTVAYASVNAASTSGAHPKRRPPGLPSFLSASFGATGDDVDPPSEAAAADAVFVVVLVDAGTSVMVVVAVAGEVSPAAVTHTDGKQQRTNTTNKYSRLYLISFMALVECLIGVQFISLTMAARRVNEEKWTLSATRKHSNGSTPHMLHLQEGVATLCNGATAP
ncbi:hypothetical protein TraAM80_08392, partial [Trypanosoma rangeli]